MLGITSRFFYLILNTNRFEENSIKFHANQKNVHTTMRWRLRKRKIIYFYCSLLELSSQWLPAPQEAPSSTDFHFMIYFINFGITCWGEEILKMRAAAAVVRKAMKNISIVNDSFKGIESCFLSTISSQKKTFLLK